MDNPKKLATPGTQDEDNHPYPSTNKQNNVNKKRSTFELRALCLTTLVKFIIIHYVEFVLFILYVAINALFHSFKEEGSCSNVPFVFLSCMPLEKKTTQKYLSNS